MNRLVPDAYIFLASALSIRTSGSSFIICVSRAELDMEVVSCCGTSARRASLSDSHEVEEWSFPRKPRQQY